MRKVFEAFMSPGSGAERLSLFVCEYFDGDKVSDGGGVEEDGEEIELLELSLDVALAMIGSGDIADADADADTIMLLQYATLHGLLGWLTYERTQSASVARRRVVGWNLQDDQVPRLTRDKAGAPHQQNRDVQSTRNPA